MLCYSLETPFKIYTRACTAHVMQVSKWCLLTSTSTRSLLQTHCMTSQAKNRPVTEVNEELRLAESRAQRVHACNLLNVCNQRWRPMQGFYPVSVAERNTSEWKKMYTTLTCAQTQLRTSAGPGVWILARDLHSLFVDLLHPPYTIQKYKTFKILQVNTKKKKCSPCKVIREKRDLKIQLHKNGSHWKETI